MDNLMSPYSNLSMGTTPLHHPDEDLTFHQNTNVYFKGSVINNCKRTICKCFVILISFILKLGSFRRQIWKIYRGK